jgi:hypothetical protein
MTTKADFIAALGGAEVTLGSAKAFTTTHAAETLTVAAHGRQTDDGPLRLSNVGGQLPTGLTPFRATNGLTLTPGAIADDVVEAEGVYYAFAADPTTGTPDGSVGDPFLVDVGGTDTISLANLVKAINASGVGGTDYSVEIVAAHADVEAVASDGTTLSLRAKTTGVGGNLLTLSVAGDDGLAADTALFAGGLDPVDYYAIRVDDNTLQVSLTPGGAVVTFSDDGTGTHVIGATAQGLADALEAVVNDALTSPGNRVQIKSVNVSKLWEALVRALV